MIQHLGYMHLWMPPAWPIAVLLLPMAKRFHEGWLRYMESRRWA